MSTDDTALLARAAHALRPGADRAELRAALEAMVARLERLVQVHDDTAAERAALRAALAAACDLETFYISRAWAMYEDEASLWAAFAEARLAALEAER